MQRQHSRRGSLRQLAIWLPIVTMLWAIVVRSGIVEAFFSHALADCGGCLRPLVVKHDMPLLALVVIMQMLGMASASRVRSTALRLVACAAVLLYFVDLTVFDLFAHRLNLLDVQSYGTEARAITAIFGEYIQRPQSWPVAVALAGLAASVALAFVVVAPIQRQRAMRAIVGALVLSCVVFVPDSNAFVYAWSYRNLAEVQRSSRAGNAYSAEFIKRTIAEADARDKAAPKCVPGRNERRNVMLVVVESLSSHHSRYFSGLADWTPEIDAIARQGLSVIDFYANGFSTSQGWVALLTGHDPLPSSNWSNNRNWRGATDSVAFRLKRLGYATAMLSNVDLDFLESKQFLESIGFDEIEGYKAPAYDGAQRFQWNAPADDTMFERVVRWTTEQPRDRPYFVFVSTLSTHQPYTNPRTGERSEEAAFRYVDHAFGAFVAQLRKSGFFDNGILLATGDHRTMTPVSAAEVARFGDAAPARIPLIAIGAGIAPSAAAGAFQQADLPASIEYLVAPMACFTARQRNLFAPQQGGKDERCIVFSRGDEMDAVDLFCGDRHGRVRLDGDATAAESGYVPKPVIDDINRDRIGWFERQRPDGSVARSLPPEASP